MASTPHLGSHVLVHRQLQDLVVVQQDQLDKLRHELEREEHIKTKAKLASESEKLQFALGEIDVLSKQLEREKAAFENALGLMKNKAQRESQQASQLKDKCSEVVAQCELQEDILNVKDLRINDLKQRLTKQKQAHKAQMKDLEIQQQQDAYISRLLEESGQGRRRDGKTGRKGLTKIDFDDEL
ncbi:spermatogenesis-associated protein 24-like isoform X2 [Branchiostoma floridae x Branchiostoma japonicum]